MAKIKNFLIWINKFNQRQWFFVSLLTTSTGVWFSLILTFWGTSLGLLKIGQSGSKEFTKLGLALTIITVGWSFLSMTAQRYCDYKAKNSRITENDSDDAETMYEIISSSVASICEDIVLEKLKSVEKAIQNPGKIVVPPGTPCVQLKKIISELISVTSKLLSTKKHNVKEKNLYVNIFYCFPFEDEKHWYKADSSKQSKGLKIAELLNHNTTFYQVLHSSSNFIYYNNKETAKADNHYLPDNEEVYNNNKIVGSIACFKYSAFHNNNEFIKFIVTISTYGKKFCKNDDKNTNDNIAYNFKSNIMCEYEHLISNALCDLYISHIKHEHDSKLPIT